MADLDEQWHAALGALTELALTRVTVVAMPAPDGSRPATARW